MRLKGWGPWGLSFKSGAREGGGERKLQVGGRLLVRGVEPIKKRAEDKEKGTFKEKGTEERVGVSVTIRRERSWGGTYRSEGKR